MLLHDIPKEKSFTDLFWVRADTTCSYCSSFILDDDVWAHHVCARSFFGLSSGTRLSNMVIYCECQNYSCRDTGSAHYLQQISPGYECLPCQNGEHPE